MISIMFMLAAQCRAVLPDEEKNIGSGGCQVKRNVGLRGCRIKRMLGQENVGMRGCWIKRMSE